MTTGQNNRNGYAEMNFNPDRTQVYATITPPTGKGRPVTAEEILDRLRDMGVMYGYREEEILKAVRMASEPGQSVFKALVAQGVLPENGTDAQILWKIPESYVSPLPRKDDGALDYFAFPKDRKVNAGQVIASVIPARPGSPGKTLTAPLASIPQQPGKEIKYVAGNGVGMSEDRLQFIAQCDGIFEVHNDKLIIHPLEIVDGDLPPGDHHFAAGVIIMGSVKGGAIQSEGLVAIKGIAAGVTIRAKGDVYFTRAARCWTLATGDVHIGETLMHSDIITPGKLIGSKGSKIYGGSLSAQKGVEAWDIGMEDFTSTKLVIGQDQFSPYRVAEVDEEIRICEQNVHRISQTLRLLAGKWNDNLPADKKAMAQKLMDQRNSLEQRIRELLSEKRTLMLGSRNFKDCQIYCQGTIYPGVWITILKATTLVEIPQSGVEFTLDSSGRSINTNRPSVSRRPA
jgi:uncharacterized protein (DUF342 family)